MEQLNPQPTKIILVGASPEQLEQVKLRFAEAGLAIGVEFLVVQHFDMGRYAVEQRAKIDESRVIKDAQLAMEQFANAVKRIDTGFNILLSEYPSIPKARKKRGYVDPRNRVICKPAYTEPRKLK